MLMSNKDALSKINESMFSRSSIYIIAFFQTSLRHAILTSPKQFGIQVMWLDERFYFLDTSPNIENNKEVFVKHEKAPTAPDSKGY